MTKCTWEIGGTPCSVFVHRMPHEDLTFVTVRYAGRDYRFSVGYVGNFVAVDFLVEFDGSHQSAWFTLDPDRANDPQLLQDVVYDRLVAEHLITMNRTAVA